MNVTNEAIRERIESLLGWKPSESDTFSLPTLAAFVRGKDPGFDRELAEHLAACRHWFVPKKRTVRR